LAWSLESKFVFWLANFKISNVAGSNKWLNYILPKMSKGISLPHLDIVLMGTGPRNVYTAVKYTLRERVWMFRTKTMYILLMQTDSTMCLQRNPFKTL
jgi:hypothetical protein